MAPFEMSSKRQAKKIRTNRRRHYGNENFDDSKINVNEFLPPRGKKTNDCPFFAGAL